MECGKLFALACGEDETFVQEYAAGSDTAMLFKPLLHRFVPDTTHQAEPGGALLPDTHDRRLASAALSALPPHLPVCASSLTAQLLAFSFTDTRTERRISQECVFVAKSDNNTLDPKQMLSTRACPTGRRRMWVAS